MFFLASICIFVNRIIVNCVILSCFFFSKRCKNNKLQPLLHWNRVEPNRTCNTLPWKIAAKIKVGQTLEHKGNQRMWLLWVVSIDFGFKWQSNAFQAQVRLVSSAAAFWLRDIPKKRLRRRLK